MKRLLIVMLAIAICVGMVSAKPPSDAKGYEPGPGEIPKSNQMPLMDFREKAEDENRPVKIQKKGSDIEKPDKIAELQADTTGVESAIPAGLEVGQNYPNPFNSDTEIKYSLPVRSSVQIVVYNIFGQKVKTIKDEIEDSGNYSVSWDGRGDDGDLLASGMYYYVFASDDNYLVRKMMFLK